MTTEQTALQRLKEMYESATPVSWDTIPYIKISRTALPALIAYCKALEEALKGDPLVSTDEAIAIEAARARLDKVCQK